MKRHLFAGALLLGAGALGWFWAAQPKEPSYQHKPLRYWLAQFTPGKIDSANVGFDEAIRAMGSNAVPFLVAEIRTHDSEAKNWLIRMAGKQSLIHFRYTRDWERQLRAMAACRALGPDALAAIPDLEAALNNPSSGPFACRAFATMGVPGIYASARALTNRDVVVRGFALSALLAIYSSVQTNQDSLMRDLAVLAIDTGYSTPMSDRQTLERNVNHPDPVVRLWLVAALARSQGYDFEYLHWTNAAALLQRMATDSDPRVRVAVTNAWNKLTAPGLK